MLGTTIFLAKLIGPIFLLLAASLLLNPTYYVKMIKRLDAHDPVLLLQAVFGLIIGFAIVTTHNIWTTPLTIMVSLVGWVSILKSVFFLFAPEKMIAMSRSMRDNIAPVAWVCLLFGAYLTWAVYLQ